MKANVKGDNGAYVLWSAIGVNGTTEVFSPAETMNSWDTLALVLVTTGTLAGAWDIQAANDFVPALGANNQGSVGTPNWGTVKSIFTPALVAVVSGGSIQPTQAPFGWSGLRVAFTPTSGTGNVLVLRVAKGAY